MNDHEPFRPSVDYGRSLSQGGALGGCIGSLYLALLTGIFIPDSKIFAFTIVLCVACGFSIPFLYWLSLVAAPFLDSWLIRIHRGRLPMFTLAGGCIGIIVGLLLLSVWFLLRRPIRSPDFDELVYSLIFATIPFSYGAASGAFIALAMGNQDGKYMDRS